jgi:hypothetical protein
MDVMQWGPPNQPNLNRIRSCASPLVFATGYDEAPFSVLGSGFIVSFHGTPYFLTTAHAVGPADPRRVVVYPAGTDPAIQVRNFWRIQPDRDDSDSTDFIVLELEPSQVTPHVRTIGRVVNLTPETIEVWLESTQESTFFLMGYPSALNRADYDVSKILSSQVLLRGVYVKAWTNELCHELRVANPHKIQDFSGLSGAPVFSCLNGPVPQPVRFCGMALRGTPSSGTVHFLAGSQLLKALERIE